MAINPYTPKEIALEDMHFNFKTARRLRDRRKHNFLNASLAQKKAALSKPQLFGQHNTALFSPSPQVVTRPALPKKLGQMMYEWLSKMMQQLLPGQY